MTYFFSSIDILMGQVMTLHKLIRRLTAYDLFFASMSYKFISQLPPIKLIYKRLDPIFLG